MFSVRSAVVILCVVNGALFTGAKKACPLDDSTCVTQAANVAHKLLIEGVPEKVNPSDPLVKDKISADLTDLKYTLSNAKMMGLLNCKVDLVKVNRNENTFIYNLACPSIKVEGDYEVNGKLGGLPIEGNGKCKVDSQDYHIMFTGKYEATKGSDGKEYIRISSWEVNVEPKGKVSYELQNLLNGDKEKSAAIHNYVQENTKAVDDKLRPSALNSLMGVYIKNINDYLSLVPIEVLFAQ